MSSIAEKVISGDVRAVARLIRDIDDGIPGVRETMKELYPHTGKAYIVGITGAPGVGKSTLVDQMVASIRKKGATVGVLAVDPTSPFSGGAILGDRIRMQRHSMDEGVFIRSLATRGHFGGLTQSTRSAINVLDAMGKDYIIVETVGVGQDEVDVVKNAHTTVIVVIPGMGDDIQAIKAGILEVGDIFVINKADREGADRTLSDLRLMIDMDQEKYVEGTWKPPIIKAQAIAGKGIMELLDEIERHREYLISSEKEAHLSSRARRVREELAEVIKGHLIRDVLEQLIQCDEFEEAVDSILQGETDPYTACDVLLERKMKIPADPRKRSC
ncbi:MAG: methylmalonyl Co-A mutase-associated GTPase MeaB [Deltaproteobacteria bacterium]|nr:methylmalonyl Co-A mutase-associated GTPase MeaB [Deltaproteobacteria bacterium]MBW2137704.1 methylmalonyl Co-A mutase-associated GTPase MeaB [Deltaproteobacteria bacterium]